MAQVFMINFMINDTVGGRGEEGVGEDAPVERHIFSENYF